MRAIKRGDSSRVIKFAPLLAPLDNLQDDEGDTPLIIACRQERFAQLSIFKFHLIDSSPLSMDAMNALLSNGSSPNTPNKKGETPLHAAAHEKRSEEEYNK